VKREAFSQRGRRRLGIAWTRPYYVLNLRARLDFDHAPLLYSSIRRYGVYLLHGVGIRPKGSLSSVIGKQTNVRYMHPISIQGNSV